MKIEPFALERHFARHEFSARYLLSASDCEALSQRELLELADDETRELWNSLVYNYTESMGHPLLRREIAALYEGCTFENVVTAVPEEGIFLLMHGLLEPGDHVVCTYPAYQSLFEIARSIGCEVAHWESDEARGWWFDPGRLEALLRPNTKLVVVNWPHNPTGFVPDIDEFRAVIDIVRRRGIHLLSDEMYRFLEIDPGSTLPSACELYPRAASLFGLSKSFGLPGLRAGWLASRDLDLLERVKKLKDYTTICGSAPGEILAIMALRNRDHIIGLQRERLRRNIAVLDTFMAGFEDCFSWNRPRGGSLCLPRLLLDTGTEAFCEKLLDMTGIMLLSSTFFQYGDRHVRIGFGRENFPEVIGIFSEYLENHYR